MSPVATAAMNNGTTQVQPTAIYHPILIDLRRHIQDIFIPIHVSRYGAHVQSPEIVKGASTSH